MITLNSKVFVADNSGALIIRIINNIYQFKSFFNNYRNNIVQGIIIQFHLHNHIFKKGDRCQGLIVLTKKKVNLTNQYIIYYKYNSIILIDKYFNFIGTRILRPLSPKIKSYRLNKLYSLISYFK